jgi:hypothetical protein
LKDIADNLTDDFKTYWDAATLNDQGQSLPYELIFSYIKYISMQPWYREQKKIRKRMYFCIPKQFRKEWIETLNADAELESIKTFLG